MKIRGIDVRISDKADIKRFDLMSVGSHVSIDSFTYISTKLTIGDWVHIAPFVSIIGGCESECHIGALSGLASGTRIICGSIDFMNSTICSFAPKRKDVIGSVVLEPLTGTGSNSIVMPNIRMAIGSVLGAGSVLMEDTKPWGLYVGNPARFVKYRNKEAILFDAKEMGYEF